MSTALITHFIFSTTTRLRLDHFGHNYEFVVPGEVFESGRCHATKISPKLSLRPNPRIASACAHQGLHRSRALIDFSKQAIDGADRNMMPPWDPFTGSEILALSTNFATIGLVATPEASNLDLAAPTSAAADKVRCRCHLGLRKLRLSGGDPSSSRFLNPAKSLSEVWHIHCFP